MKKTVVFLSMILGAVILFSGQTRAAYALSAPCTTELSTLLSAATAGGVEIVNSPWGVGSNEFSSLIATTLPFFQELEDCASFAIYSGEEMIVTALNDNTTNLEDSILQDDTEMSQILVNAIMSKDMGNANGSSPSPAVSGSGCQSVDAAAQMATGRLGQTQVKQTMTASIGTIRDNTQTTAQSVAYVNTQTGNSFSPSALFIGSDTSIIPGGPTGSSSSSQPTENDAVHYIMNVTDPNPPPRPTSLNANSPAARGQIARIKIHDARMNLAQDAMTSVAAWNTASYPLGSWLTQSVTSMGAAPPTTSPSGLVSQHQVLSSLVNARFANPNWYSNVAVETQGDLMRESLYENAITLRLLLNIYEILQRQTTIAAADYALKIPK